MRLSSAPGIALSVVLSLAACVSARPPAPTPVPPTPSAHPTSTPVAATAAPPPAPLLVGAYWYPWYGADGRHWREGYRGTPLLGEYDSADEAVIRQQIAWASAYGVDFFAASWWGRDSYEDSVIQGPLQHVLANASADGAEGFRFCILYESPGLLGMAHGAIALDDPAVMTRLVQDFTYLAQTTFDDPAYLRIDGRPVVFLYLTRAFRGDVQGVLNEVRAVVKDAVGVEPFLIGDEVYWQGPSTTRIEPLDGVTAYNMHTSVAGIATDFASKVRGRYALWADAAARDDVAFVPDVIPGFDDTAVRPEAAHPVIPRSPELFAAQLVDALQLASGAPRMVMITSWNEWHEDTAIEPSEEFGFDYLDVLSDLVKTPEGAP